MKPIKFKEANKVLAEDQPEYLPLPVHIAEDAARTMTSCWQLTWRERVKILFTGKMWWSQMTFNQPLQPQLPMIDNPWNCLPVEDD